VQSLSQLNQLRVSVMLSQCMDIKSVAYYPWLLAPIFFLVATVLAFNFMGDGLRDAADPYAAL